MADTATAKQNINIRPLHFPQSEPDQRIEGIPERTATVTFSTQLEKIAGSVSFVMDEEYEIDRKWEEAFRMSQDFLSLLADEGLAEYDRGETLPLEEL